MRVFVAGARCVLDRVFVSPPMPSGSRKAVFTLGVALWSIGSANTKLGVAKRVAGNIRSLSWRSGQAWPLAAVAGDVFCPLTRFTPPSIVCGPDAPSAVHAGSR